MMGYNFWREWAICYKNGRQLLKKEGYLLGKGRGWEVRLVTFPLSSKPKITALVPGEEDRSPTGVLSVVT